MKHIKDINGFTSKATTNEIKRTPGGIDVWLDTELGVEDLFEELKARLQKLQEETNEYGWRKALKESERDLEKWADNLEKYSSKWGLIGTDTNTEA